MSRRVMFALLILSAALISGCRLATCLFPDDTDAWDCLPPELQNFELLTGSAANCELGSFVNMDSADMRNPTYAVKLSDYKLKLNSSRPITHTNIACTIGGSDRVSLGAPNLWELISASLFIKGVHKYKFSADKAEVEELITSDEAFSKYYGIVKLSNPTALGRRVGIVRRKLHLTGVTIELSEDDAKKLGLGAEKFLDASWSSTDARTFKCNADLHGYDLGDLLVSDVNGEAVAGSRSVRIDYKPDHMTRTIHTVGFATERNSATPMKWTASLFARGVERKWSGNADFAENFNRIVNDPSTYLLRDPGDYLFTFCFEQPSSQDDMQVHITDSMDATQRFAEMRVSSQQNVPKGYWIIRVDK